MENKQGWHGKSLSRAQYETMGDTDALQYTKTRGTIRKPHTKKKFVFAKAKAKAFPQKKEMATREAFGRALVRVGSRDTSVVVVDAEVSNSTKTEFFKELYPDRFFEMFIAEQNMVGVATGLAHMEKKPFVSSFAAFLIRAADQIRMSQYANVNIVFVGSHVGVSIGKDGFSQMALGDIAFFRSIRQSTIVYPADGYSMQALVSAAVAQTGIVYIRSTRAKTPMLYKSSDTFRIGGSKTIHSSQKDTVTVVSAGITLHEALSAYRQLKAEGIRIRVIDAYSIKPIDKRALAKAARETRAIIVVEDHYPDGGLGDVVTNALYGTTTPIHRLAVSRTPRSGRPEKVLHFERIDKRAIIQAVRNYAKK